MKFPSLKNLAEGAVSTIKRYPFEVLFALAGTIAATTEVELRHLSRENEGWCMRIIMTANLGLLLSLAATLYIQSVAMVKRNAFFVKIIAAIIASLFVFIINPSVRQADYTRFFLMSLSLHLLVAFAAFTGRGQVQGFWQFNKTLFLRFLTSVLYGVVLFAGLAAAIGATNFLFNFNFEWDTYAILWVWIAGMFTTVFFLAGVPVDTPSLDADTRYPKGLKIFTQYVLIPLSTVYVVILLAYEVKILLRWSLPQGLVSTLILSYAVFGILSLLLVYPIRERDENKWLKTYSRSFYFLLVPLLFLLFVAVGARVFSYGITEYRYFLILLACWLLFISVYFLLFKKQNIKLIPISLCLLTLLSIYGPQSAFSVAMYSQRRIVVKFFEKHNAFKNGRIIPVNDTKINKKEGSRGVNNLQYFIYNYDITPLQPYFTKDLQKVADSLGKQKSKYSDISLTRYALRDEKYEWARKYLHLTHFETYYYAGMDTVEIRTSYQLAAVGDVRSVKGYDYIFTINAVADTVQDKLGDLSITRFTLANKINILKINNETIKFNPAEIIKRFDTHLKELEKYHQKKGYEYEQEIYKLPADSLTITGLSKSFEVKLQVEILNFNRAKKDKEPMIESFYGSYFIKRK